MDEANVLAFVVVPYLSLTIFAAGHAYRYFKAPYHWNASSSELLEKRSLKYGVVFFHWGMILTFVGHAGGLLIPQAVYDALSISGEMHTQISIALGTLFGLAAFAGILGLIWRRLSKSRVLAVTRTSDWVILILLLLVIGAGLYNVFFGGYYILDTIAPWIRSIVLLAPKPELMVDVPLSYKIHVLGAFIVFGVSPFTRLVHIWSVPLGYLFRSHLVFRRRAGRESADVLPG